MLTPLPTCVINIHTHTFASHQGFNTTQPDEIKGFQECQSFSLTSSLRLHYGTLSQTSQTHSQPYCPWGYGFSTHGPLWTGMMGRFGGFLMHKKNSSFTILCVAGMVGYAMPPKEELVTMLCSAGMLCYAFQRIRRTCQSLVLWD